MIINNNINSTIKHFALSITKSFYTPRLSDEVVKVKVKRLSQ